MSNLIPLTYSQLKCFRNCRQKYAWRYVANLRPIGEDDAKMWLGSAFHAALEKYWSGAALPDVLAAVDTFYPDRFDNGKRRQDWNLCRAMVTAYYDRYSQRDAAFTTQAVEMEFAVPIINPETGAASRTFEMRGKIDAVLQDADGRVWLMEHKTASRVDANYLNRLVLDFQIQLYSNYFEAATGQRPYGVIYDAVQKYDIKQAQEESQEDFEIRYSDACAKNKSGTSNIKRSVAESDADYVARLLAGYNKNRDEWLCRVELGMSDFEITALQAEVWDLTQQILFARRTGFWYRNTDMCMMYNRECEYLSLCLAKHPENLIDNSFEVVESNPELSNKKEGV